jgi:hypothetical protein
LNFSGGEIVSALFETAFVETMASSSSSSSSSLSDETILSAASRLRSCLAQLRFVDIDPDEYIDKALENVCSEMSRTTTSSSGSSSVMLLSEVLEKEKIGPTYGKPALESALSITAADLACRAVSLMTTKMTSFNSHVVNTSSEVVFLLGWLEVIDQPHIVFPMYPSSPGNASYYRDPCLCLHEGELAIIRAGCTTRNVHPRCLNSLVLIRRWSIQQQKGASKEKTSSSSGCDNLYLEIEDVVPILSLIECAYSQRVSKSHFSLNESSSHPPIPILPSPLITLAVEGLVVNISAPTFSPQHGPCYIVQLEDKSKSTVFVLVAGQRYFSIPRGMISTKQSLLFVDVEREIHKIGDGTSSTSESEIEVFVTKSPLQSASSLISTHPFITGPRGLLLDALSKKRSLAERFAESGTRVLSPRFDADFCKVIFPSLTIVENRIVSPERSLSHPSTTIRGALICTGMNSLVLLNNDGKSLVIFLLSRPGFRGPTLRQSDCNQSTIGSWDFPPCLRAGAIVVIYHAELVCTGEVSVYTSTVLTNILTHSISSARVTRAELPSTSVQKIHATRHLSPRTLPPIYSPSLQLSYGVDKEVVSWEEQSRLRFMWTQLQLSFPPLSSYQESDVSVSSGMQKMLSKIASAPSVFKPRDQGQIVISLFNSFIALKSKQTQQQSGTTTVATNTAEISTHKKVIVDNERSEKFKFLDFIAKVRENERTDESTIPGLVQTPPLLTSSNSLSSNLEATTPTMVAVVSRIAAEAATIALHSVNAFTSKQRENDSDLNALEQQQIQTNAKIANAVCSALSLPSKSPLVSVLFGDDMTTLALSGRIFLRRAGQYETEKTGQNRQSVLNAEHPRLCGELTYSQEWGGLEVHDGNASVMFVPILAAERNSSLYKLAPYSKPADMEVTGRTSRGHYVRKPPQDPMWLPSERFSISITIARVPSREDDDPHFTENDDISISAPRLSFPTIKLNSFGLHPFFRCGVEEDNMADKGISAVIVAFTQCGKTASKSSDDENAARPYADVSTLARASTIGWNSLLGVKPIAEDQFLHSRFHYQYRFQILWGKDETETSWSNGGDGGDKNNSDDIAKHPTLVNSLRTSNVVTVGSNGDESTTTSSSSSSSSSSIVFFPIQPFKLSALPAGILTCFFGIEGFALLNDSHSDFIRVQLCCGRCPTGLLEDQTTTVLRNNSSTDNEPAALVSAVESSPKIVPEMLALPKGFRDMIPGRPVRIVRDGSVPNSLAPPLHEVFLTLSQKPDALSLKKRFPLVLESSDLIQAIPVVDLTDPVSSISRFIQSASAQAKASIYMPLSNLSKDKSNCSRSSYSSSSSSSTSSSHDVTSRSPRTLCLTVRSAQHAIGEVFTNDKQTEFGHSTPSAFWFSKNDDSSSSSSGGRHIAAGEQGGTTEGKKGSTVPFFAILGRVVSVRMQVDKKNNAHDTNRIGNEGGDAPPAVTERLTTNRIKRSWLGFGGKNNRKNAKGIMKITLEAVDVNDGTMDLGQQRRRPSFASCSDSINVIVQYEGPQKTPTDKEVGGGERALFHKAKASDKKFLTQLNSYLDGAVLPLGFGPGCILAITKVERRYPSVNQTHRPYLMGSIGEDGTMIVLQTQKDIQDFKRVHIMIDAPLGSEQLPLWRVISDGSCSRAHFWLHNVKVLEIYRVKCMWVCIETGDELEPLKQDMALLPSAMREMIDSGEKLPIYSVGHALGAAGAPSEVALSLPMIRSKDRHKFFSALAPSLSNWKETSEPALSILSKTLRKKVDEIVLGATKTSTSFLSSSSFNDVSSSKPSPFFLAPGGASFVFSCGLKIADGTGEARVSTSDRYVISAPDLTTLTHGTYLLDIEHQINEKINEMRFPLSLGPSALLTNMTKRQLQHWMAVCATVGTLERLQIFGDARKGGKTSGVGASDVSHFKSKELKLMIATELAVSSGVSTRLKRDRVAALGQLYNPLLHSFAEDEKYLRRLSKIKDMILYATNPSLFSTVQSGGSMNSMGRTTKKEEEREKEEVISTQSQHSITLQGSLQGDTSAGSSVVNKRLESETLQPREALRQNNKKVKTQSEIKDTPTFEKPLCLFKQWISDGKITMNVSDFESGAGLPEALYYFSSCLSNPYIQKPTALQDLPNVLLPQHIRIGESYFDSAAAAEALYEQLVKFTRDEFSIDEISQRKRLLCERRMTSEREFDHRARAAQTEIGAYSREMIWRRDAAVRTWARTVEDKVTEAFSSSDLVSKSATSEYLVPREPNTQPVHPRVYEKEVSIGLERLKSLFLPLITLRVVKVIID